MPVVLVLTLSPLSLECGLSLCHSKLVVKIPLTFLLLVGLWGDRGLRATGVASVAGLYTLHFGLGLVAALLFLFLFQRLNHSVDGLIAVFFRHLGEGEQRVLKVDGLGEGG